MRHRSTGPPRALIAIAILAVLVVVVAWIVSRRPTAASRNEQGQEASPSDSLAALSSFEAYQHALALGERMHFVASLQYFRRALTDPPDAWQPYAAYGTALFQSTHEVRTHRGLGQPVVRSSFERVELVREAGEVLARAERFAPSPKDRAYVISLRVKHLLAWGLDWDAYSEFTRAEKLDPSLGPQGDEIGGRLKHPTLQEGDGEREGSTQRMKTIRRVRTRPSARRRRR